MGFESTPFLLFIVPAALCALLALVLLFGGRSRRRGDGRALRALFGLAFALVALALGALGLSLLHYQRLARDTPVATLELRQLGVQRYGATVARADGTSREYELLGDEWQLDARVLRWKLPAVLAGAPPLYRLERLSGRYGDLKQEREAARSVYALDQDAFPDLWTLRRQFPRWLGFVDARYGSAAYLPMLDGARYAVYADARGGLVAKPADARTERLLEEAGW